MGPGNYIPRWRKFNLNDLLTSQECLGIQLDPWKGAGSLAFLTLNDKFLLLSKIPVPVLYATVIGTYQCLPVWLHDMIAGV